MSDAAPLASRSIAVVGADHQNKSGPTRRFEIAICLPGEPVVLTLEPKNPADPNAVAVYSERYVQLGYLPAERAPWIGARIREGREISAIFQQQTEFGAVIRIAFDGEVPILPATRPEPAGADRSTADDDVDFWPDFIPPDD